ncbi:hypothetical protein VK792_08800 [Mesobacterium sp. TK19101]|uniref:Uncharacterized protein n=1 Tax=Mesobacterium hydrothermale TaxID=3111907 RepID=A0ABU6HG41_9RHOB|nr:hypothetical protein [Mesobacterium sp. TK19101]MEC3861382.1 hypothetical protein [Mesobacterium sp. TK19101]
MTAELLIGYASTFVGGPALYSVLMRLKGGLWAVLILAGLVIATAGIALSQMRHSLTGSATPGPLVALFFIWLSWVLAVSMVALSFRSRFTTHRGKRRLFLAGLLATTLPWFGLATARMMAT